MSAECTASKHIDEFYSDGGYLACWLPFGHDGPHYDEGDDVTWQEGKPAPADDPPEYGPDDAEAQRIAEACADANREHDRIEQEEAGR